MSEQVGISPDTKKEIGKKLATKIHTKQELFLLEKIQHKQWNIKARKQQWLERLKSTPEANVG